MNHYQHSYSNGHPLRLTKKERSRGVPAEITNFGTVITEDGTKLNTIEYKTGIGTGIAKFNLSTEQGKLLYDKFLKLFERGKTNGKTKKDGLQENCTCGQIGNIC